MDAYPTGISFTHNYTLTNAIIKVYHSEVFKQAIKNSGAAVILIHNHPSGECNPSSEDIEITKRLREAGKIVGIDVLDHVVIGDGVFVSLKERGMI